MLIINKKTFKLVDFPESRVRLCAEPNVALPEELLVALCSGKPGAPILATEGAERPDPVSRSCARSRHSPLCCPAGL